MKYRVMFCLPGEWADQYDGQRYDINEAHRNFEQWSSAHIKSYPLDRWMIVEETTDLAILPISPSIMNASPGINQ